MSRWGFGYSLRYSDESLYLCVVHRESSCAVNISTSNGCACEVFLLNGIAFGKVSGLVYVAAAADGYVVGEELEGDYFEDGWGSFTAFRMTNTNSNGRAEARPQKSGGPSFVVLSQRVGCLF